MKGIFIFLKVLLITFLLTPVSALALDCDPTPGSSFTLNNLPQYVINQQVSIGPIDKNTLQIEIADLNKIIKCTGGAGSIYRNAFRVDGSGLTLSSTRVEQLGFGLYLNDENGVAHTAPANNVCVAPDVNCNYNYADTNNNPIPFYGKVLLKRTSGAGNWSSDDKIPAGTEIARLQTYYRSQTVWYPSLTWIFILKDDLVPPDYTCNITQYDKSVTLPNVSRTALQSHGNGRYPDVKKEFQFALNCDASTAVSVTFEGDVLNGTDNVLKNAYSGNDNIGVQMLFSDNTPVKLETKYPVISSAQENEILKLNAYYYYKGGDVGAGPIKANTTFMFDYQ